MEKPQAQNAGDDQKGGHDIAEQPRTIRIRTPAISDTMACK
jgi:hypothetical protein